MTNFFKVVPRNNYGENTIIKFRLIIDGAPNETRRAIAGGKSTWVLTLKPFSTIINVHRLIGLISNKHGLK